jgi:adenylylsulfate kinase-like enzyme
VQAALGPERFIEIYVDADVALCRERRPDANFDGFEAPEKPILQLRLDEIRVHQAIEAIIKVLEDHGQFDER